MSDLKICFLQVTSPEIYEYSKYSTEVNKKYCAKQGYDYIELPCINTNEFAHSWSKVFQSMYILENNNYDYIFFLDADAVVINFNKRLEEVISKMKNSMAFSENGWNGGDLINGGSFIVSKNGGLDILKKSVEKVNTEMKDKKFGFPWEQSVFTKLHEEGESIDVFPMNEINSYWLYDVSSNDGQFIYHFMARPLNEKIEIAKNLYEKYK